MNEQEQLLKIRDHLADVFDQISVRSEQCTQIDEDFWMLLGRKDLAMELWMWFKQNIELDDVR